MKRLALTVFALALASAASAEQFYKWQDSTGAWHYTKDAPKGQQSQVVNVGPGRSVDLQVETATGTAAADNAKPGDAKPGDTAPGEPEVANADTLKKMQEASKVRAANCERAKTNVATLESYTNVTIQRDGKDVTLNDDERAAELKRARQQVDLVGK